MNGIIWRVTPADPDSLIGEERDTREKRTTFFCLDPVVGTVRWEGKRLGDDWWVGIEAVRGGVLYLHGFATPDLPGHRGITAVDVLGGRTMWSNSEVAFLDAGEKTVIALRGGLAHNEIVALDSRTGALQKMLREDDVGAGSIRRNRSASIAEDYKLPVQLAAGDESPPHVHHLVNALCNRDSTVGFLEYIVHTQAFVLCYHEIAGKTDAGQRFLRTVLKVADRSDGTLLFQETLNTRVREPVPDSAFLLGNVLYYVKGGKMLAALPLLRQ